MRKTEYPNVNVTSRLTTHLQRNEMPVFYVQIGKVSFYMHNGVLVRVICGDLDLFLETPIIANLFKGEKIGKRVSLSELKFKLIHLLGEQSMEIIEPFIDKVLGVNEP